MKQIKVLALDPSLTRSGWCLLDGPPPVHLEAAEFGSFVSTDPSVFAKELRHLVDRLQPGFIVYEASLPFIAVYGKKGLQPGVTGFVTPNATQLVLPKLEGVILGMAEAFDLPVLSVAPRTWRSQVLGNGNLAKDAAKAAARTYVSRLGLNPKNHDAAEAICIAMYGAVSKDLRWRQLEVAGKVQSA